ncbi:MAG TPA: hypothetical protein VFQ67_11040 [Allosphingosinicella sp.]|jgi:hypothetical protein|nr:hypothetical protein [Allosphingosinicella sp.]
MTIRNITHRATVVLLLVTATSTLYAQTSSPGFPGTLTVDSKPLTLVRADAPILVLPCCRCVDGTTTTVSLNTGSAPWGVLSPAAPSPPPTTFTYTRNVPYYRAVERADNAAWAAVDPAKWVGPPGAPRSEGEYTYLLQFRIQPCVITPRISLAGRFAGDNRATLYLDSAKVASTGGDPERGFYPANVAAFDLPVPSGSGVYLLKLVVFNSGSVTAAILQGAITVTCPNDPLAIDIRARQP